MGAFRKRKDFVPYTPIGTVPMTDVIETKTIVTDDNPEPTTYVTHKRKPVEDYAESLGLPADEDYQLRDMIRSGNIPEEVPVAGILNSNDPLDLSNQGEGSAIFDRLASEVASREQKQPSQPVSTPEPTTTPSE